MSDVAGWMRGDCEKPLNHEIARDMMRMADDWLESVSREDSDLACRILGDLSVLIRRLSGADDFVWGIVGKLRFDLENVRNARDVALRRLIAAGHEHDDLSKPRTEKDGE